MIRRPAGRGAAETGGGRTADPVIGTGRGRSLPMSGCMSLGFGCDCRPVVPAEDADGVVNSGTGSKTSVWRTGDQTPRKIPVGSTPA
jgi:hypothetical protein